MSRHSILAVAWVAAALFIAVAPPLAAQEAAHGHAAAPSAPGHPTAAQEAESIAVHELGGGEGHKANPLQPELPLAFWTVIVFLGLLFILGKFAWKPLLTALHAREEHLASGRAVAEVADYLVAFGDLARFYVEGALEAGMKPEKTFYFSANVENAAELEAAKRAVADLLVHELHSEDPRL